MKIWKLFFVCYVVLPPNEPFIIIITSLISLRIVSITKYQQLTLSEMKSL